MHNWIEKQLADIGKTKAELARRLDLPFPRIAELIGGKRKLQLSELQDFSSFLQLTNSQVLMAFETGKIPPAPQLSAAPTKNPSGTIKIPELNIFAGMGNGGTQQVTKNEHGGFSEPDDIKGNWHLPAHVLKHTPNKDSLYMFEVRGDSMEESIPGGSIVMVDQSDQNPYMPGIFALDYGHGQMIKRLYLLPKTQTARIISDSDHYPDEDIDINDLSIHGRVVGFYTYIR